MKDTSERKHSDAAMRLLAIHEKLGTANEAEIEKALEERSTEGASIVVIETVFMTEVSALGAGPRIEYASTRTASSVA